MIVPAESGHFALVLNADVVEMLVVLLVICGRSRRAIVNLKPGLLYIRFLRIVPTWKE